MWVDEQGHSHHLVCRAKIIHAQCCRAMNMTCGYHSVLLRITGKQTKGQLELIRRCIPAISVP